MTEVKGRCVWYVVIVLGLCRIEWVELDCYAVGIEIRPTEVEVNDIDEQLFIAESPATHCDGLDSAVDAFSRTIVHFQNDGI